MLGKTATELIAEPEIKKHEILGPAITESSLVLMFGPRGCGKSNIALGIAHSAATGSSLLRDSWRPYRPYRVTYLDSELGRQAWRKKIAEVDSAAEFSLKPAHPLRFITHEDMGGSPWNISDPAVQEFLLAETQADDLIIIDNLLDFSGELYRYDTDTSIWRRVEIFLKKLRTAGKSVIVVHHAGKSGDQLGTIEHEKPMDTVIKLMPVFEPDFPGMKLDMHFTKSRWFFGGSVQPLRVEYQKCSEEQQRWNTLTLREAQAVWAERKFKLGWKLRDIAKTLQIHESQLKEIMNHKSDPFFGPPNGTARSVRDNPDCL